jgi:hypothetical protein
LRGQKGVSSKIMLHKLCRCIRWPWELNHICDWHELENHISMIAQEWRILRFEWMHKSMKIGRQDYLKSSNWLHKKQEEMCSIPKILRFQWNSKKISTMKWNWFNCWYIQLNESQIHETPDLVNLRDSIKLMFNYFRNRKISRQVILSEFHGLDWELVLFWAMNISLHWITYAFL